MRKLFVLLSAAMTLWLSNASAQTTCSWNTINNGDPADATKIMNNFGCLAPLASPRFTGNVGVGTTNTNNSKFAVNGAGEVNYAAFSDYASATFLIGTDGAGGVRLHSDGAQPLMLGISSNDILNILPSGEVGVGTTSTGSSKLAVNGAGKTNYAVFSDYASATFLIGTDGSGGIRLHSDGAQPLKLGVSSSDILTILSSGNVGIGTTTPAEALEVNGQIQVDSLASATATNLCITGTSVLSSCSSSLRYKEQIKTSTFGLKDVMAMRPVTFKWKGRDERDFGFIAEEVAKISPLFVTRRRGQIEGVKYPQLTAVLTKAVQEQQVQIVKLMAANAKQATEVAKLRSELASLEKKTSLRTASR